ncbi:unnamed protein product [Brassicogethes aeneus]|uniref:Uncharacterized protein n=1 Tax=Brassicogethes aeneus TaxID=1431903 RepID=A0A9P0FNM4_BRAAE|nr:unnamed protein product [Brassicogethes aeneus]
MGRIVILHQQAQLMVCYACFSKVGKTKYNITGKVLELVKKIHPNYIENNNCSPSVLCGTCYFKLKRNTLNHIINYNNFKDRIRRYEEKCCCQICETARFNIVKTKVRKQPPIEKVSVGRPRIRQIDIPQSIKICSLCKSEIHKGLSHSCTLAQKVSNVVNLADTCRQQVVCKILKTEESAQNCSNLTLNKGFGSSLSVQVQSGSSQKKTSPVIDTDTLSKISIDCRLPINTIKKLSYHLRQIDKHLVEPNAVKNLKELSHSLDEYFECVTLSHMESTKNTKSSTPFVFCHNLPELVAFLLKKRDVHENSFHLKFGVDGGGGSLKVCLNLLSDDSVSDNRDEGKNLNSGINKLIIIGLAPETIESYNNLKTLLHTMDLQSVCGLCPYTLAIDMKLIMIFLGLQSNSSSYPCPYCEVCSKHLKDIADPRTIQSISRQNDLWLNETGGNLSKAKLYKSCVNKPLIVGEENTKVLKYVPPPELHLLLGITQRIFDDLKRNTPDIAEAWIRKSNLKLDHYQRFNGNNARRLLKTVEDLAKICPDEWEDSGNSDNDVDILEGAVPEIEIAHPENLKPGSFILAQFKGTGKRLAMTFRYVATILKVFSDDEYQIKCLKSLDKAKTTFDYLETCVSVISKESIIGQLSDTTLD